MITELRTAIYQKVAQVFSRCGFDEVPEKTAFPYAIITKSNDSRTYDSVETYPFEFIQVAMYSDTLATLETLEASLTSKFDRAQSSWSLTNYRIVEILKLSGIQRKVDKIYTIIHQYSFELEAK